MAPLPTSNPSENGNPISTAAATNIPCSCLSSFAMRHHLPFSSPSRTQHPSHNEPTWGPPNLVSAVEGYVRALRDAASGNPFLKSVLSLSDNIQSFCQMRLRNLNSLNSRDQNSLSAHNFAAILPGDSVAGLVVANGLTNFLNLYNTLLVCRIVLTWFPGAPPAIATPLSTLCDPYLNIFRGIIPPLGGTLDLSPILAFFVLNAFSSTAAALPAELPESRTSQHGLHSSQLLPLNLTTIQQKWKRRLSSMQNKNPEGAN